ncbi:MAG: hypothetical protein N7Q72_05675 [Spiroplasma sp. Tabriz.8]|nr:hypothetical protein [Spiroplasma sp. Tabriz.8]
MIFRLVHVVKKNSYYLTYVSKLFVMQNIFRLLYNNNNNNNNNNNFILVDIS